MCRLWPVAGINAGILWYVGCLVVQNLDLCQRYHAGF